MLYANLRGQWGIPLPQFRQAILDMTDSDYIPLATAANIADLHIGFALIESPAGIQAVEITEVGHYIVMQEEMRDPDTGEIIQPLEKPSTRTASGCQRISPWPARQSCRCGSASVPAASGQIQARFSGDYFGWLKRNAFRKQED